MMSVFENTDVPEMADSRARVGRVGIGIKDRPLRRRSRCYHPFAARDLGFKEAISQHRYNRDRIEDEDQQYHGVDQVDVELIEGNGDHHLETDPVEQGQRPGQLCIPWAPEPIGSARRRREGLFWCRVDLINVLHVQSLSGRENSTGRSDMERVGHHHDSAIARKKSVPILSPSPIPPLLHACFLYGPRSWVDLLSERTPR